MCWMLRGHRRVFHSQWTFLSSSAFNTFTFMKLLFQRHHTPLYRFHLKHCNEGEWTRSCVIPLCNKGSRPNEGEFLMGQIDCLILPYALCPEYHKEDPQPRSEQGRAPLCPWEQAKVACWKEWTWYLLGVRPWQWASDACILVSYGLCSPLCSQLSGSILFSCPEIPDSSVMVIVGLPLVNVRSVSN